MNTFFLPLKFSERGWGCGGGVCGKAFEMPGGRRAQWTDSHNESENLGGEASSRNNKLDLKKKKKEIKKPKDVLGATLLR